MKGQELRYKRGGVVVQKGSCGMKGEELWYEIGGVVVRLWGQTIILAKHKY